MQFARVNCGQDFNTRVLGKILVVSFILVACCCLLQCPNAMATAEDYDVTFNYNTDKGKDEDKDVAAAEGAKYEWKVIEAPANSTYKWTHTGAAGKWTGGGTNQDFIKLLPYGASGNYTVNVKVYPPGEGGVGQPWEAGGHGDVNQPTVEFNEPSEDQYVAVEDTPKNINVEVVAKHGTNTLGGVEVTFSDANSKGSFGTPNPKTTDGVGVATIVFTTSTTVGDVSKLRAKTGGQPQDGPEVTIFKVEITTPSADLTSLPIDQNLSVQATLTPSEAQGGNYTWSKVSGTGGGAFSPNGTQEAANSSFSGATEGKFEMKVEYEINGAVADSPTKKVDILPLPELYLNYWDVDYLPDYEIRLLHVRAYAQPPSKPSYYADYYDRWAAPSHPDSWDTLDAEWNWDDGQSDTAYGNGIWVVCLHEYAGSGGDDGYDPCAQIWSNCKRKRQTTLVQTRDCTESDSQRVYPEP